MENALLVEGHACFRENLTLVLGQEPDLEVSQAGSLAEGRVCLAAGEVDIAVVGLPSEEGDEMIRELRQAGPPVPVLALTLSLDPAHRALALEAGAKELLAKGTSLEEVVAAVRRLRHKPSTPRSSIT
jgi:DNA-binding NarL/FixJ family response regulator